MLDRIIRYFPNIFTLSNLGSGIVALVFIVNHLPLIATLFVVLSAVFDMLDGKIARSLKVTSEFGVELDSLADIVSFGVVPALALYETIPHQAASTMALMVFPIAGALRLARFNTRPTKGYFEGLPIPAAGLLVCFLLWFPVLYGFTAYAALVLSILMVSKIRFKKV
ncbi:CDP-diacylglycerol--serine O-phosphatidyltransferase [Paenibacillus sp. JMULE4]|uniref:CDP-diacylglycerol--serine O-phosphatidyltransferase n=1 Tax=Paenibacillus naphthalenovorans TaxID=162209 RepID=A0A0U2U6D6_9BACL|nr:CDP-diacylglycerol--serine O-phosphatidyltransferase [Paenibacillus naphthalenovorans]NTZ16509.1 CDP-diacylglycerol--serine O-phosphatidyltransferase [Paenibacillus sp. JMULE4]